MRVKSQIVSSANYIKSVKQKQMLYTTQTLNFKLIWQSSLFSAQMYFAFGSI